MYLCDLPPEIFQHVIYYLVSSCGIRSSWVLCATCKTFARDIRHEILNNLPLRSLVDADTARMIDNSIGMLLMSKLTKPLDAETPLLDKIRQMYTFIKEALRPGRVEAQELLMKLCGAIGTCIGKTPMFIILGQPTRHYLGDPTSSIAYLSSPLNLYQKIIALIAVGDRDMLRTLLPQLLR
ncbi:hypothetical protein EK21DRAFT_110028 [Setomelanomma holmii]|uniref:F-box domain-containing protein n=1 Tax=Setomelanomma holmii TaxID=210430 RepID=A0A9P4HD53_9PLEO|nr:hypothetical protein EK21DRAFT_110028 [Setomelanomma holmii]